MTDHAGPELLVSELARYRRDGYLAVRQVFEEDETRGWSAECDRLWRTPGLLDRDNLRNHVLESDRSPDRLDPVIDLSLPLREASLGVVRRLAARLLDDDAALFKDKLIFKPPGAHGYRMHQDYAYWHWLPVPPDALVTAMVAIDPAHQGNGAVEFWPGLHDRLLTSPGAPSDVDEAGIEASGEAIETRAGDVVVFHSLTPHRSADNGSEGMRRQLYLSYSASQYGDLYRPYYQGLHDLLRQGMSGEARARSYFR